VRISATARTQRRRLANRSPPRREPRSDQGRKRERDEQNSAPGMTRCEERDGDRNHHYGNGEEDHGWGTDAERRLGLGHRRTLIAAVAVPQLAERPRRADRGSRWPPRGSTPAPARIDLAVAAIMAHSRATDLARRPALRSTSGKAPRAPCPAASGTVSPRRAGRSRPRPVAALPSR
jgi:hypothetical protein